MKYLIFWEFDYKDLDALIEKFGALGDPIVPSAFDQHVLVGQPKTVGVYEADNHEDIQKLVSFVAPHATAKVFPLVEVRKAIELWKTVKE